MPPAASARKPSTRGIPNSATVACVAAAEWSRPSSEPLVHSSKSTIIDGRPMEHTPISRTTFGWRNEPTSAASDSSSSSTLRNYRRGVQSGRVGGRCHVSDDLTVPQKAVGKGRGAGRYTQHYRASLASSEVF